MENDIKKSIDRQVAKERSRCSAMVDCALEEFINNHPEFKSLLYRLRLKIQNEICV